MEKSQESESISIVVFVGVGAEIVSATRIRKKHAKLEKCLASIVEKNGGEERGACACYCETGEGKGKVQLTVPDKRELL